MNNQQKLNAAEDMISSLHKDVDRMEKECAQILNDAIANIDRKAAEIARLNVGIKSFQDSFYRECKKTKQLQQLADGLEETAKGAFLDGRGNAIEEAAQLMEITSQWVFTPDELAAKIRALAESV